MTQINLVQLCLPKDCVLGYQLHCLMQATYGVDLTIMLRCNLLRIEPG